MKVFNTTAVCDPSKHYMVDISERIEALKDMVDSGKYFCINRARQYGKTTTLFALERVLSEKYYVVSMDFQDYGAESFHDADTFCRDFTADFCGLLSNQVESCTGALESVIRELAAMSENDDRRLRLFTMFKGIKRVWDASDKPVVLFIDEVDSATNNQLFIDFLAALRSHYLKRQKDPGYRTFQSVILAGVTDVKHLKRRIRDEADDKENSPWNIAADFTIDMSLSEAGIKGMLDEYEADHHTGMDTEMIAEQLREYTNGYPFLVSRICEHVDTEVSKRLGSVHEAWTKEGLGEAVKLLISEDNTLFQTLTKNLNNYPELKSAIRSILMEGTKLTYNPDQDDIVQMKMFGFIRNDKDAVRIDNRIFETRLYNLFLSDEELKNNVFSRAGDCDRNIFIQDGKLDVRLILTRFIDTYHEIYGPLEEKFREKDGREQFLLYLKPIINGTGNYYIEAQTRDQKRTDVMIDYPGQQYIIELKIWRGERYKAEGEKQISEYLDHFGLTTGYMLSFNFNKNKETGVKQVHVGDKLLYEGVV